MRSITKAALAAASIAGALAFAPLAAHAGSYAGMTGACANGVSTVGAALDGVEAAIYSASFTNSRDQTNMLGKVRAAASKASLDGILREAQSVFAANHGPDTAMTVRGGNIPRESG